MTGFLDLPAAGLSEWQDPATAAAAGYDSAVKLMAAIIATRLVLQTMHWKEKDRAVCRKLERELDDLKHSGYMLSSLLNASRAQ